MKLILNMFYCLIIEIHNDLNMINKRTSLPYFGGKLSCICLMFAEGESKEEDIAAQRPELAVPKPEVSSSTKNVFQNIALNISS